MRRRTPRPTRTDTPFPYTALFRSAGVVGRVEAAQPGAALVAAAVVQGGGVEALHRLLVGGQEGDMIAVAALERAAVGGTPDDDVGEPVLVREGDGAAAGLAAAEAEQRENGVVEGLGGGPDGRGDVELESRRS